MSRGLGDVYKRQFLRCAVTSRLRSRSHSARNAFFAPRLRTEEPIDACISATSSRTRSDERSISMSLSMRPWTARIACSSVVHSSILNLGAKKAFLALCERLRNLLVTAQRRNGEIREMLSASFGRLNAEFGFSLAQGKPLDFDRFTSELQLIESNYVQYLGLTLALRLAQPKFMEQFRRMLISKLRVVFENASSELELWNKAVSAQVDSQLRERRTAFKRRRETLEKIQSAAGELELRIDEIETQDQRLVELQTKTSDLAASLRDYALVAPFATDPSLTKLDLPLFDDAVPVGEEEAMQRQA